MSYCINWKKIHCNVDFEIWNAYSLLSFWRLFLLVFPSFSSFLCLLFVLMYNFNFMMMTFSFFFFLTLEGPTMTVLQLWRPLKDLWHYPVYTVATWQTILAYVLRYSTIRTPSPADKGQRLHFCGWQQKVWHLVTSNNEYTNNELTFGDKIQQSSQVTVTIELDMDISIRLNTNK